MHWGAKELKHLGALVGGGVAKAVGGQGVKQLAKRATKLGARGLGVVAPALVAADLAKNPWHVAKWRAEKRVWR